MTTLGEITVPKVEQGPPPEDRMFTYIDISSVDNKEKAITGPKRLSGREAPSRARQHVQSGDVLVSMTRPNLNAVAVVPQEYDGAIASTGFDVLRPIEVEPKWVYSLVRSPEFVATLTELVKGALYPAVRADDVRQYRIPLPPLPEQRRIVARIEELQARTRRAREALKIVPALLERLRQSVLASAFCGDLTAEWRESHPDVESGSMLLSRIGAERRRQWEETQLDGLRAQGKPPKSDQWKRKYGEPEPVDSSHLPDLPKGWAWGRLESLVDASRGIPYGIVQTGQDDPEGVATVRGGDLKSFALGTSNLKRVAPSIEGRFTRTRLLGGEVLIAIRGTVGETALVREDMAGMNISREVAMIPVLPGIMPEFLMYALGSPEVGNRIKSRIKGVAQAGINLSDLRELPIPIAPMVEQRVIVERITDAFNRAQEISKAGLECTAAGERLEQSVLAKAFRGELVRQDPNDEPARVLLGRIRASRAVQSTEPKKRRTRRGKNMSTPAAPSIRAIIRSLPEDSFDFDDLRRQSSVHYEQLRDEIFALLQEPEPELRQIFDSELQAIRFLRLRR